MDPVLDRVRAADPVLPGEFAGLADFDALVLEPSPRPRRRRRLLALPALGAVLAAVVLVPSSAPQAREIVRRASAAVDPSAGILYAQSAAENRNTDGTVDSYGTRRVWVHGTTAMRWLEDNGNEEVYARGEGTTRFDPRTGKVTQHRDVTMVPNDIFRASQLLSDARAGKNIKLAGEETVDGRAAYVLRWDGAEGKGLPDTVHIELTLWVDRETYAPLRYTDHSWGLDRSGKPMDQTYVETVQDFQTLPDTPANRKLLALGVR